MCLDNACRSGVSVSTVCSGKRDQKYFPHNFNKFSLVPIILGDNDLQSMLAVAVTAMHGGACRRNVHHYY